MIHRVRIPLDALKASMNVLGAFHPTSGEARGVPTRLHRVDDTVYLDVASPTTNRAATRHEIEPDGFTGVSREVMVPHPPLAALIDKADDEGEGVVLAWNDDPKITGLVLTSGRFEAQVKEREAEPNVTMEAVRAWSSEADACASATMPAESLLALLDAHAFASPLPGSGGISGVKFHRAPGRLGVVATNGFLLAHVSVPVPDGDIAWPDDAPPLIVARYNVAILRARVAALPADARIRLWHTRSHLALACDAWHAEVRALDPRASFPDWQPILRKLATAPYRDDVTLDANEVAVVVKRVSALANGRFGPVGNSAVRLHLGEFSNGLGVAIPVSLAEGEAEVHDQLPVAGITDLARDGDRNAGAAYNGGHLATAADRLFRGQKIRALTRDGGALYLAAITDARSTEFVIQAVRR